MHFWFVHSSELSLHEQIVRQVSLGILTGELAPGERLPSIRALARRFGMHANTVSAAYRELRDEHWVDFRPGSGVYVPDTAPEGARMPATADTSPLDHLLQLTVSSARGLRVAHDELLHRLTAAWCRSDRLTLVEADEELALIVLFEIEAAGRRVPEICPLPPELFRLELKCRMVERTPVVLPSKAAAAREAIGPTGTLIVLGISPVAASLARYLPISRDYLVGIVSHWPQFIDNTRAMLVSSGFAPEAIICCDARFEGWDSGLDQAAGIVCDSLTRTRLRTRADIHVFPLLSPEAMEHFAKV